MRLATTLFLVPAAVSLLAGPLAAAPAARPIAQVLRQGPDGFTLRIEIPPAQRESVTMPDGDTYLRVTIPGFFPGGGDEAGSPDLPRRGFPFGLPEDATASVRARVLASESFSGAAPIPVPTRHIGPGDPFPQEDSIYEPASAAYGSAASFPAEVATLSPAGGWRHQRVQAVVVHPVRVSPATGAYEVARTVEVEVTFSRDARAPRLSAFVPAGPDAPGWDELMDDVLVNSASAGAFRMREAAARPASAIVPGQPYVRVRFGSTGVARVSYAQLAAAGFPAATPIAQVRVEERGYNDKVAQPFTVVNQPRIVEDVNGDGLFGEGDSILFYGFNHQDRYTTDLFADERYCYFHAYWVTPSAEGGAEYPTADGYPAGDGYVAVTSFPQTDHYENDLYYINNPPDAGSGFFPNRSSFYWFNDQQTNVYTYVPSYDYDPAGNFNVRAFWQGLFSTVALNNHLVSLAINSCQLLNDGAFDSQHSFDFQSGSRPSAGCLVSGSNTALITGRTTMTTSRTGAAFDWLEFTYDRLLKARGNQLAFNSGTRTGSLEFAITDFTAPGVIVLDITSPAAPVRLTPQVVEEGGKYTARIRATVGGTRKSFVAFVPTSVSGLPATTRVPSADLGPAVIAAGLPRDLLAEGDGSDIILITHPSLEEAWAPLVAHREAQGHQVFVCDVLEIYDQFAGGDKTPWAIQRFLAQAFRTWSPAPSYVLLGGDASEDYRGTTADSDPDYVPTMMHFANVPGPEGKELAGNDNWYVGTLRATDPLYDVYPEMHIARLPVGSVDEVNTMVDKIIAYEDWKPEDTWRNRAVIVADDQYSTSITFNANYCYKPQELTFRRTSEAMCDSIHALGRLPDFDCDLFLLDAYLDTVAALGRDPGNPSDCLTSAEQQEVSRYTRREVTPLLLQELSQGELIWEYTGHANKNQITTEALLQHYPKLSTRDFDKINNLGKPFIFFGYACHLNEFENAKEKVSGECMGEALLLAANRRGSIASIASTAYEWLPTNPDAQIYTTRTLFWNLPRDPETGRPRRILGEAMTRAWTANALEHGGALDWREMFRTYLMLGDPALRVDVTAPGFEVRVNGETMADGTPIEAAAFGDTLRVTATVSDDVDLSSIRVWDGPTELPADRITIVDPESGDEGAQDYQIAFATTLRLGDYEIALEARDWAGRTTRHTLPVTLGVQAYADGRRLERDCSSVVDSTATIRFEVTSPAPLQETGFTLVVDGSTVTPAFVALDDSGRRWSVETSRLWASGQHSVLLQIQGRPGESVSESLCFTVSGGETRLLSTYFHPNPCEEGEGALYYALSQSVKRARLNVYTVSGRRVRHDELPTSVGQNAYVWDLRDEAGDRVANGVYLFRLEIEGYDGRRIRRLERVAVTR